MDGVGKKQLLTPAQVAERLQVTERTVYKWLSNGELPAAKLGRVWRISEQQLQKFIDERGQGNDKRG